MSLGVDITQDTILVLRKLNTNIVCDENVILVQTDYLLRRNYTIFFIHIK